MRFFRFLLLLSIVILVAFTFLKFRSFNNPSLTVIPEDGDKVSEVNDQPKTEKQIQVKVANVDWPSQKKTVTAPKDQTKKA